MRKELCVPSVEDSHRVGAARPALMATSTPVQEQRMSTVESKGHPPSSLIPYFLAYAALSFYHCPPSSPTHTPYTIKKIIRCACNGHDIDDCDPVNGQCSCQNNTRSIPCDGNSAICLTLSQVHVHVHVHACVHTVDFLIELGFLNETSFAP